MPANSATSPLPATRSGRPARLRRLRAGAWWLLLGVFAFSVAAWIDSYTWRRQYSWGDRHRGSYTFVNSTGGALYLEKRTNCDIDHHFTRNHLAARYYGVWGATASRERLGFGYYEGTRYSWYMNLYPVATLPAYSDPRWQREPYRMVRLPYWPPMLLGVLALPFIPRRVSRWRAARRARRGLCQFCAYNLTGNTSGICPECGGTICV